MPPFITIINYFHKLLEHWNQTELRATNDGQNVRLGPNKYRDFIFKTFLIKSSLNSEILALIETLWCNVVIILDAKHNSKALIKSSQRQELDLIVH